MQKVKVAASILITVVVVMGLWFEYLYYSDSGDYASKRISFKVEPGATFKEVQAKLVKENILKRPAVFRWAAYLSRRETKIQSGRYLFRRGENVASILHKLVAGEVNYTRVVIPEGLMVTEIASILQKEAEIDSASFVDAAHDSTLIRELGIEAPSLEGYLFPDTYLFDWPMDSRDAIKRMVYRFNTIYRAVVGNDADSLGMSRNQVVTLASIIEAEAAYRSEMPRISAVYHNRLKSGWRLEADPTVAYALGGVRRRLWTNDLKVNSPYNTYRHKGLPPGAICNPGRAALAAAVKPDPKSLDFYFVADGTGHHKFSKTYYEHLKAKHLIKYGPVPEHIQIRSAAGSTSADSSNESSAEVPDGKDAAPPKQEERD